MKPYNPEDEHAGPGDGRIHYFLPGRLILQFQHPPGLDKSGLVKAWKDFLEQPNHTWKEQLTLSDEDSIIVFKGGEQDSPVFSLVPLKMRDEDASEDNLVALIKTIYEDLKEPLRVSGEVTLKSVSPNWLVNGTSHQIALGGPGGWPEPAENVNPGDWPQFKLLGKEDLYPLGSGAGVHVAVLDTAPQKEALDEALARLGGQHRLLTSLWGPGNPLKLYPAPDGDLQLVADYSLLGHRYRMPDHGLFAAGILRTLASEATLHLVEVLNPFGASCVETIAKGLVNVLNNPAIGRPLIINLSLVLSMPRIKHNSTDFPKDFRDDPNIQRHMTLSLEDIFTFLKDQGEVIVVAAAGNDSHGVPGKPSRAGRQQARFPAAFTTVIGVGALPKSGPANRHVEPASYSNLSDDTPVIGYATLGGEAGAGQGILGIFISGFPEFCGPLPIDLLKDVQPGRIQYRPNTNGWARWAGTSFATPVISGLLAALGAGRTLADATQLLDSLVSDHTRAGEKEILVDQP